MTHFSPVRLYSLVIIAFFSLMLFSVSQFAYADQAVGQVVWVHGGVQASSSAGGSRALQRRSPVYEQDTITTSGSGSGEIVFTDNSVVTLRAGTTFKLDQYKYNPSSPDDSKYVASVAKGGFRTITGLISKANPDGYQVNTPVATIGVRGTDYSIFYSRATGLAVKLSQGRIIVANPAGTVELDVARNRAYAAITDLRHPPTVTDKPSSVFNSQPALIPTTMPPGGPGGTSGPGGVSQTVTPTGPAKQVSGFCIN